MIEVVPNPFESIAFFPRAQSRLLMMSVARKLKEQHGGEIHIYCYGPQEVKYYQDQNTDCAFASVNDANQIHGQLVAADSLDAQRVFDRAKRYEERIGYTINRMIVQDRHLGRGYALGGFYHMRSRTSERTGYVEMVDAVVRNLEYWEREFTGKSITLCMNGSREAAYVSQMLNVPFRVMAGGRLKNLHYWAWNEMYETPVFAAAWEQICEVPQNDLEMPYYTHRVSRANYRSRMSFLALVKRSAMTIAQSVYWKLRGYQKGKNYFFKDRLTLGYRIWRDNRQLEKIATTKLADLKDKRFVYFPLHMEPEMALHGISPEYFYQHTAIAALSRDLPAGVYLAVKEAFGAIGRRPDTFYRQIAELKNVIWLETWEPGLECVQQADVVATICGTAGLEGLVAGKPVISFGHHNIYNFQPSVRVVEDERNLVKYLDEALSGKPDSKQIRDDAKRLLKAIEDNSFDLKTYDYVDLGNFDEATVNDMCQSLAKTLEMVSRLQEPNMEQVAEL
jgi:hypothetical protein